MPNEDAPKPPRRAIDREELPPLKEGADLDETPQLGTEELEAFRRAQEAERERVEKAAALAAQEAVVAAKARAAALLEKWGLAQALVSQLDPSAGGRLHAVRSYGELQGAWSDYQLVREQEDHVGKVAVQENAEQAAREHCVPVCVVSLKTLVPALAVTDAERRSLSIQRDLAVILHATGETFSRLVLVLDDAGAAEFFGTLRRIVPFSNRTIGLWSPGHFEKHVADLANAASSGKAELSLCLTSVSRQCQAGWMFDERGAVSRAAKQLIEAAEAHGLQGESIAERSGLFPLDQAWRIARTEAKGSIEAAIVRMAEESFPSYQEKVAAVAALNGTIDRWGFRGFFNGQLATLRCANADNPNGYFFFQTVRADGQRSSTERFDRIPKFTLVDPPPDPRRRT